MLNRDDAISLARRAVDEKGADYVYPDSERRKTEFYNEPICQYMADGKPSCIVGHIMAYIGHPVPEASEGRGARSVAAGYFDPHAVQFLADLQDFQDRHYPWGVALNLALGRN